MNATNYELTPHVYYSIWCCKNQHWSGWLLHIGRIRINQLMASWIWLVKILIAQSSTVHLKQNYRPNNDSERTVIGCRHINKLFLIFIWMITKKMTIHDYICVWWMSQSVQTGDMFYYTWVSPMSTSHLINLHVCLDGDVASFTFQRLHTLVCFVAVSFTFTIQDGFTGTQCPLYNPDEYTKIDQREACRTDIEKKIE